MLGTMPDVDVARQVGRHRHQVAIKRMELGMKNWVLANQEKIWAPKVIAKLGKVSDQEIADQLGVSKARVSVYHFLHWIPARD